MILLIVAAWLGLLALLVKIGVFKGWSLWMKISPVVIFVLGEVLLLVPMKFDSPSGPAVVMNHSVQVTPGVSGIVTRVPIESEVLVKQNDILFELDDRIYQAEVDRLKAKLALAEQNVARQEKIARINEGATNEADAQRLAAEVAQVKAELEVALWDLEQTKCRAPFDGFAAAVLLRPGTRVTADSSEVLSFVDNSWREIVVQIEQNNLRNVEVGQTAEVIFKLYPGKVFPAKVDQIMPATTGGTLAPSGFTPESFKIEAEPFWVVVKLDDASVDLPPGAVGTAAIYTATGTSTLFRKIVMRMKNWVNFIVSD